MFRGHADSGNLIFMSLYATEVLSEDEFAELDTFLLALEEGEGLSVDEVHGYITAIIASSDSDEQQEWLPQVWGEPVFADESEKDYMTEIMRRMYSEISEMLQQGLRFEPLVIEEENEEGEVEEAYEGWCFGFMRCVAERQDQWGDLPKKEQELLSPIAKLALLCTEEGVDMDEDEYELCVELLPGAVAGLFSYWHPGDD
jgi:uncharacterized protein